MTNYYKYLSENIQINKPKKGEFPFSRFLFWDSPLENINIETNKNFIIERVLSRGLLQDFYYLLQLYTRDDIITAVKKSRILDPKTVNFCSHYFKIPLKELNASSFYN